jgi:3-oxoacyl-[acyl-carrier-protein] synthase II
MTERNTRRVAITGIGAITPVGTGREAFWNGIRAERSAVRSMTRFDPSIFRSHNAAQVDDFTPEDHIDAKRAKRLDRFGQFSVAAARLALEDSGIRLEREDRERVGAMMGTALGGIGYAEEQLGRFLTAGLRAVDATLALAVFGGAASCNIAIEFGVSGPNSTNAMSCASGTMAIGEAFRQIRHGYADVMIAGGAEAPLAPLCFGAFALIRAMSTRNDEPERASRPFDKDRDGFVMGEGSVVLTLEEWGRAESRGAKIYAELCGYGTTNDAHHMTAPLPTGAQAARSMRLALTDANLAPHEIGYINAHGSSTPLNDPSETLAIKTVFGEHAGRIPVSGT